MGFRLGQFVDCVCAHVCVCFSADLLLDRKSGEFRVGDSVSLLAFQPGFSPKACPLTHNIPLLGSFLHQQKLQFFSLVVCILMFFLYNLIF